MEQHANRRGATERSGLTPLVLYGASGYARTARDYFVSAYNRELDTHVPNLDGHFEVKAFIDDERGDQGFQLDDVPIIRFETWQRDFLDARCAVTVSDPGARRRLVQRMADAGAAFLLMSRFESAVSPTAKVGEGTLVGLMNNIGPATVIGNHVQIMTMDSIGHDCSIGDFVTICPSVSISGQVIVEDDVFLGVGCSIINGTTRRPLRVGRGAKIAAGAVVMRSVPANATVAGNPARELRKFVTEAKPPRDSQRQERS